MVVINKKEQQMAFNANDNIGLEMAERLHEDYSAPICLDNFFSEGLANHDFWGNLFLGK